MVSYYSVPDIWYYLFGALKQALKLISLSLEFHTLLLGHQRTSFATSSMWSLVSTTVDVVLLVDLSTGSKILGIPLGPFPPFNAPPSINNWRVLLIDTSYSVYNLVEFLQIDQFPWPVALNGVFWKNSLVFSVLDQHLRFLGQVQWAPVGFWTCNQNQLILTKICSVPPWFDWILRPPKIPILVLTEQLDLLACSHLLV